MDLKFATDKVEKQCTDLKVAKKLFGGNAILATSLFARITSLRSAENLKDIVVQKQFHFHKLENKGKKKYEGYFAIDVKTRKEPWRIILEPLDEEGKEYNPCNIDEIAGGVKIVRIEEVSNHYE